MCGPHELQFKVPVELRLPHCASLNAEAWSFALKSSDATNGNQVINRLSHLTILIVYFMILFNNRSTRSMAKCNLQQQRRYFSQLNLLLLIIFQIIIKTIQASVN